MSTLIREAELQEAYVEWYNTKGTSNMPFDEWVAEVMHRE